MSSFTHDLLRRHPLSMIDHTTLEEVPLGWWTLVVALLRDLAEALAVFPDHKLDIFRIGQKFGALQFSFRIDESEGAEAVYDALRPIIAAAKSLSRATCQSCGGPIQAVDDAPSSASWEEHTGCDLEPASGGGAAIITKPVEQGEHKLYTLRNVANALGQPAEGAEEVFVTADAETEHDARLAKLLEKGEAGTWRHLVRPTPDGPARLDELDRLAPHMTEVTDLVRRHLQAALVVGLPITLPPVLLLGPPGLGKTWYLTRLGSLLGVPTRSYSMAVASLGEGLQGAHPSWRNAGPGLVAKTLLQETAANPLILVDEVDKAAANGWNNDPYRPFYTLLEPAGARTFADEYLGFSLDAHAMLWVLAGNSLDPLPAPIRDRLTIITIPPLSKAHLAAVARSIYADANGRMRTYFEPEMPTSVLDVLLVHTPRMIRIAIETAMVRAAAESRRRLRPADLDPPQDDRVGRIGFVFD